MEITLRGPRGDDWPALLTLALCSLQPRLAKFPQLRYAIDVEEDRC